MKNLVLSAAFGLNIGQVELFVKSLRKYYQEEIYFLIGPKDVALKEKLKSYNCNFFLADVDKKEISTKRFNLFANFLKENRFNNVFCCDSRDVYFQSNPFDFTYKGKINFFLEDKKIKDCPYNSNWLIKTYGKVAFDGISDKTILCSGTVLGSSKGIKEYLSLLKKYGSDFKYKKKFKYLITFRPDPEGRGCEQGHANYLVHKKIIKDYHLYSNSSGPVATVFYLKKIIFDNESRLINDNGEPYLLVHQYDKRWNEFSQNVKNFKNNL